MKNLTDFGRKYVKIRDLHEQSYGDGRWSVDGGHNDAGELYEPQC